MGLGGYRFTATSEGLLLGIESAQNFDPGGNSPTVETQSHARNGHLFMMYHTRSYLTTAFESECSSCALPNPRIPRIPL